MGIVVDRLKGNEAERIGRSVNGEVSSEVLLDIYPKRVWEGKSDEWITARIDGPVTVAGRVDDDEIEPIEDPVEPERRVERSSKAKQIAQQAVASILKEPEPPEDVPDTAEYFEPDEEVPAEYNEVEGPRGATWGVKPGQEGAETDEDGDGMEAPVVEEAEQQAAETLLGSGLDGEEEVVQDGVEDISSMAAEVEGVSVPDTLANLVQSFQEETEGDSFLLRSTFEQIVGDYKDEIVREASTAEEVGSLLGYDEPIHEVLDDGDLVALDVSDNIDIPGDEVEAYIDGIGEGWLDATTEDGQPIQGDAGDIVGALQLDAPNPMKPTPAEEIQEIPTEERLENAFAHAEEVEGYRDAGMKGGNTKGDELEMVHYADGSKDFAVPTDAYNHITTGVVSGPAEAKINNVDSPKVIEQLGGSAASATVMSNKDGEEYIVKEGVEPYQGGSGTGMKGSAVKTFAGAYFVGNSDLHRGNYMQAENGEVVIIDNDSAGTSGRRNEWMEPGDIVANQGINSRDVTMRIYDIAVEYEMGEREIPQDVSDRHQDYFVQAAEKAIEVARRDTGYDLPDELTQEDDPEQRLGVDTLEDISEGERIQGYDPVLHEEFEGEVKEIYDGDLIVWDDNDDEYVIDDLENVEEIL